MSRLPCANCLAAAVRFLYETPAAAATSSRVIFREQEGVLALMLEAERDVPRERRAPFLLVRTSTGEELPGIDQERSSGSARGYRNDSR